MLTGGMEDVYNPLLFGLNPSLSLFSLSLCLSLGGQTEASPPHTVLCTLLGLLRGWKAPISAVTHSLLPSGLTNISVPRKHLSTALISLVSPIFPDGVISLLGGGRISSPSSQIIHLIISRQTECQVFSVFLLTDGMIAFCGTAANVYFRSPHFLKMTYSNLLLPVYCNKTLRNQQIFML